MPDKLSEEVSVLMQSAFEHPPFLANEEMMADLLERIREAPMGIIASQMLSSAISEWVTVLLKFVNAYTLAGVKVKPAVPTQTLFMKKLVEDKEGT